jgi:D-alanyl-D-alanine carboxypeptidase
MRKTFFVLLIGFITQINPLPCFAQANSASVNGNVEGIDRAKLDAYFDALEKNDRFMGSVAIAKNGQILYQRSLGYATLDPQIKSNASSKYRIGSISKTFTATLILKAVEENKLSLDQALADFYPAIDSSKHIQIRHLLNHSSGIHNFTDDADYATYYTQAISEASLVKLIQDKGLDFQPGTKSSYSNSNYVLLSFILQKIYGATYGELLEQKISKPLGLKNTYLGDGIQTNKNEVQSFIRLSNWMVSPQTHPSVPLGAGAIVSNPTDLIHFSEALFNGKVVNAESLKTMMSENGEYGLGLFKVPFYDQIGWGHTGGIDGFTSVFAYFPADGLSFALTSNGTNYNNNEISIALLSAYYGKDFSIPNFAGFQIKEEHISSYTGTYSSDTLPLKITITHEGGQIFAQGTGQPAFPLEAVGEHHFKFDMAALEIIFDGKGSTFTLKQGGGAFEFRKESK